MIESGLIKQGFVKKGVIESLQSRAQRYFRRNEGSTDYATIPTVTLAGDFVIEFDLSTTGTSNQLLLGDDSNSTYYFNVSSTKFSVFVAGVGQDFLFGSSNPLDGKIHKIKYVLEGGNLEVFVDGLTLGVKPITPYTGANNFRLYSSNSLTTFNLSGILANLKIYDNGTLARNYPINDGKNILANAATALGSELDGLTYALTTAIGGVASVVLSSLSVIGKTYLVEVSYSGVVGDASVRIGGFSGPSFTGTGTIEFVATATTTVNDILGALTGVTSGSVTVSIKEAEGYGTIVNGNASDWGLFDKQTNGDWLGQELVVNGGFDNGVDGWGMTAGGMLSSESGAARAISLSGAGRDVYRPALVVGRDYRCSCEVINTSGELRLTAGYAAVSPLFSSAGVYTYDITCAGNGSIGLRLESSLADVSALFDNVSAKEVLKNA